MLNLLSSVPRRSHRSLWLKEIVGDAPDAAPLGAATRVDVAVIGGGYVGLWAAIEIKLRQRSVDVAVLEADICGSGASGRNGGFALSWWTKISLLAGHLGDSEGIRLARASVEGLDEMQQLFKDHGVDCEFVQDGWLWTAAAPAQLGAWDSTLADCDRLGVRPFQVVESEELARRTGSPVHLAGVLDPTTARVHPAKLVRGLRQIALDLGVKIYEHSPVLAFERRSRPVVLKTPDAELTADKVVIANNVWAAGMPEFRRSLVAISSDMIATEPIPERLADIGWTGGECISDSQMMIHYYRTTADGRIAFGKGGWGIALGGRVTQSFDRSSRRARDVQDNFRRIYPMLRDVRVTHDWSGAIDRSVIGLPIIGHTGGQPHVVHAVGWSANAVGPSRVGGKLIASLILELDDEWSRSPLVNLPHRKFPPEPIRYAGAHVVRTAVVAKERAENRGRPPTRLSRFLASQAPSGLIPNE